MAKDTMADLVRRLVEASGKSNLQVADETGCPKPNVVAMWKNGTSKVPIRTVPALARAVNADPAHLTRVALEQYRPEDLQAIEDALGPIVTNNEREILEAIRRLSKGSDPKLTTIQELAMRIVFAPAPAP